MVVVISVVATAVIALAFVAVLDREHHKELARERTIVLDRALSEGVRLKGATLESYAADYSLWNEMGSFVQAPDPAWAKSNLDASVVSFKLAKVWVFDPRGRLRYDSSVGTAAVGAEPETHDVPGVSGSIAEAFVEGSFFHHFVRDSEGTLLELRGAKIQREDDLERGSPALGFLVAARTVNEAYLEDLTQLLGARPTILGPDEACTSTAPDEVPAKLTLEGRDGPVATLCASVPNPMGAHSARQLNVTTGLTLGAGVVLALGLALALRALVTRPLATLNKTLSTGQNEGLAGLLARRDEFSTLAELILERDRALSQQRVLQDKVHEASRMASLGMVGAVVAHELNNPLAVVLGNADLLSHAPSETRLDDEVCRSALAAILSQSERMRDVLDRVRRLAREDESIQLERHDLNRVIAHALQQLTDELARRGVVLELALGEDLPAVSCDHVQLTSVVQNLVANARDAVLESAREVGRIVVQTRSSTGGDAVLLRVTDNGPGLADAMRESAFEPFVTTKQGGVGLGLGLALVRSITERHGGTVHVASDCTGTTFELSFPVAA